MPLHGFLQSALLFLFLSTITQIYILWLSGLYFYIVYHISFLIKSSSWRSAEINGKTSSHLVNEFFLEGKYCLSFNSLWSNGKHCIPSQQQSPSLFLSWSLPDVFSVGTSLLVQTNLPYIFLIKNVFSINTFVFSYSWQETRCQVTCGMCVLWSWQKHAIF